MAGPMDAQSKEVLGEAGLLIQTRRGNSCTLAPGAPLGPSPLTPQTEPKTRSEQLTGRTTESPEGLACTSQVYTPMTSGRRHAAELENRQRSPGAWRGCWRQWRPPGYSFNKSRQLEAAWTASPVCLGTRLSRQLQKKPWLEVS